MIEGTIGSCRQEFDQGYHIAAVSSGGQGIFCASSLEAVDAALEAVSSVRVEVTVRYLESKESSSSEYGPGDAGIQCRQRGASAIGDYYVGSLSPTGYWELDRYDAGQQHTLNEGVALNLTTGSSTSRLISLECVGEPGSRTALRFAVDGRIVGSAVDNEGLPPGSVGLATTAYPGGSVEVMFLDIEVVAAR
jgi:hypothetical protein